MYTGRLRTGKSQIDSDIEMSTDETLAVTNLHDLSVANTAAAAVAAVNSLSHIPPPIDTSMQASPVASNASTELRTPTGSKRTKMTKDEQMARRRLRTDTDEYRTQERERMRRRRAREKEEKEVQLKEAQAALAEEHAIQVAAGNTSGKGVSTRRATAVAYPAAVAYTPHTRTKAKDTEFDHEGLVDDDDDDDRDSRRQSKVNSRSDKLEIPTNGPDDSEIAIDTALTGETGTKILPFPDGNVNAPRSSRSTMPTPAALAAQAAQAAKAAAVAQAIVSSGPNGTPRRAPSKRGRKPGSTSASSAAAHAAPVASPAAASLPQYISNNTGFVPSASQSPPPAQTTHFMPPPPPVVMLFGYPAGANPPCNVSLVSVTVEHTVTNRVTMMTADDIRTPLIYDTLPSASSVAVTPSPAPPSSAKDVDIPPVAATTTTTTTLTDADNDTIIEETTTETIIPDEPMTSAASAMSMTPMTPIAPVTPGGGAGPVVTGGGKFLWEMVVDILRSDVGFDPEKEELVGFHHKDPLPLSCDRHINTAMNMAAKEGVRMPKWYIYSKERR